MAPSATSAVPPGGPHQREGTFDVRWAGAALLAAGAAAALVRLRRATSPFPREEGLDSSSALLREGYTFIQSRCRRLGSDIFETRLMLQKVFCMQGEEAARVFYAPGRFTRRGAVPLTTVLLLQGMRSVQMLDGEAHRHRKGLFTSILMIPEHIARLAGLTRTRWRQRAAAWQQADRVRLYDEVNEILCRAVCDWAGVPLAERDVAKRTRELASMIEGAGNNPLANVHGQVLRTRTERWIEEVIADVRRGRVAGEPGSAVHAVAFHRDENGQLLPQKTAATEVINVLRPTVAIGRFATFAALALHDHPESRHELQDGEPGAVERFVQEVRRFYPFFPALGGRALQPFDWRGHRFSKGTWVLLDLYGTNHDPRIWGDPEVFRPERFKAWGGSPFDFVPQGGGSHADGHRCPGERITIELLKVVVAELARARYDVPPQDLRIDLTKMPAMPASGFVIRRVRPD